MAADWVGQLITGAVGVAGVAGTFLNGRLTRDTAVTQGREQREHALRERVHAEKREAYVKYLAAVQGARHALAQIRALSTSPENSTQASNLRSAALAEVALRRSHLQLAGPPKVRALANQLHAHLATVLATAARGEPNVVDVRLVAALIAAMKDDLGIELAPPDHAALAGYPETEPTEPGYDGGDLPA